MEYANWGTMNLAETHLPESDWAREAKAAITSAGLRLPVQHGGGYELERNAEGKLVVTRRIGVNGYPVPLHREFPQRLRQGEAV